MEMLSMTNHLKGEDKTNNEQLQERSADHISHVPSSRPLLLLAGGLCRCWREPQADQHLSDCLSHRLGLGLSLAR